MKNKQLIIFDMDGTLIDSGDVISNTINYVRSNLGLSVMLKQELLESINNPDINSSEFFYGTKKFTDQQTKLFGEYYEENCVKDILLYDGIDLMLQEIQKYFTLSVATNASVEYAKKMLNHLNIEKYFDFIIGANEVTNPKPHHEMLTVTTRKLNISISDAILIGDSHKDSKAAISCNMDYLLVNWGFTQHNSKSVISNTRELKDKILTLQ